MLMQKEANDFWMISNVEKIQYMQIYEQYCRWNERSG